MEHSRLICPDTKNCFYYKIWKRSDVDVAKGRVLVRDSNTSDYICIPKQNLFNRIESNGQCLNEKIANITGDIKKLFEQYHTYNKK